MHITFSDFLKKKEESINMRKALIAGASGALIAMGGCNGPNCSDENRSKQAQVEEKPELTSKTTQTKQEAEKEKQKEREERREKQLKRMKKPGWQKPKNILGT